MKLFTALLTIGSFIISASAGGTTCDIVPSPEVEPRIVPCPYFCVNPFHSLVPNPNHKPSFNGCGSGSLTIPKKDLPKPEIEDCCNQHDICYDTCNSSKIVCDLEFWVCMVNVCGCEMSTSSLKCLAYAETLYQTVANLGCPAYTSAQYNACDCK